MKKKNRKHLSVSTLQTLHGCIHRQFLITYLKLKLTRNPIFLLAKSVVNTLPPPPQEVFGLLLAVLVLRLEKSLSQLGIIL